MGKTAPNVWTQMNYVPPRGQCNFKQSIVTSKCPCLRYMLHPLKVRLEIIASTPTRFAIQSTFLPCANEPIVYLLLRLRRLQSPRLLPQHGERIRRQDPHALGAAGGSEAAEEASAGPRISRRAQDWPRCYGSSRRRGHGDTGGGGYRGWAKLKSVIERMFVHDLASWVTLVSLICTFRQPFLRIQHLLPFRDFPTALALHLTNTKAMICG